MTSRTVALQVGYLGSAFHGYARQPGLRTVEGDLRRGLRERHAIAPGGEMRSASRTDRGVSALGNVIVFPTELRPEAAARVVGALSPEIFCFGWAPVEGDFRPRDARSRWYRYLLPGPADGARAGRWQEAAQLFVGDHDFSSFSRRDEPPRGPRAVVTRMSVHAEAGVLVLDVEAPSFLWNQVRKMVAALQLLEEGRMRDRQIARALEGRGRLHVPLAPADGLVLMEVRYDFPFRPVTGGRRAQRRFLEDALREVRVRATLLGWFQARALAEPGAGESEE